MVKLDMGGSSSQKEILQPQSLETTVSGGYSTEPKKLEKTLKRIQDPWAGSSPGGVYVREIDGGQEKWYVKFGRKEQTTLGDDQLRAEFIAQRIYRRLGFNVPETHLATIDRKLALVKRDLPDIAGNPNTHQLSTQNEVKRGFLVDVYLNNWDITYNFGVSGGNVYRLDSGGALDSRAKGERKSFEPLTNTDMENFQNPNINPNGARIYSQVREEDKIEAANLIAGLTNQEIAAIVKAAGYEDRNKEIRITSILIRRRENIKELFGIVHGEKPKEHSQEEEEIWQKLLELLPRDAKLDSILTRVEKFNNATLSQWISFDKELLTKLLTNMTSSLNTSNEQTEFPNESFADVIMQVTALEEEVSRIEQLLQSGEIPEIDGNKKRGFFETLKLKFDSKYRLERIKNIDEYCQKKRKVINDIVNNGYGEIRNNLDNLLNENIEKISSYQNSENSKKEPGEINTPDAILETAKSLSETIILYKKLKLYIQKTGFPRDGQQKAYEMMEVEEKILDLVKQLSYAWEKQVTTTKELCSSFVKSINNTLSNRPEYGYLGNLSGLAEFLIVPTKDQEDTVADFCKKGIQFLDKYNEPPFSNYPKDELSGLDNRIKDQRSKFRERCEKIRSDVVCHMTLTNKEYAESILREGFIVSSRGQRLINGRANVNSPAGLREPLYSIALSVNGAELQYGGQVQELTEIEGVVAAKRSRAEIDKNLGVGFVFPYVAAVSGHQFYEQGSSQGLSYEHYNELHIFDPNYDSRFNDERRLSVVKIDINEGLFIAPESQSERWIGFLSKPTDKGGAGKDQTWIDEHVRFYPEYTNPRDFVELNYLYGGLNFPKNDQVIFVPTGNSAYITPGSKTPLFRLIPS